MALTYVTVSSMAMKNERLKGVGPPPYWNIYAYIVNAFLTIFHILLMLMFINPLKLKRVEIIYENSVRTSKKTLHINIKISTGLWNKEVIAVYTENHAGPINTKCTVADF
jgi:hypothetical protein